MNKKSVYQCKFKSAGIAKTTYVNRYINMCTLIIWDDPTQCRRIRTESCNIFLNKNKTALSARIELKTAPQILRAHVRFNVA